MARVPDRGLDRPKTELGGLPGCAKQDWGIKMGMLGDGRWVEGRRGDKRWRMNVWGMADCLGTWQACEDFGEFEGGCEMRLTLGHQSRNLIEQD
jgi:hypothetical protein